MIQTHYLLQAQLVYAFEFWKLLLSMVVSPLGLRLRLTQATPLHSARQGASVRSFRTLAQAPARTMEPATGGATRLTRRLFRLRTRRLTAGKFNR